MKTLLLVGILLLFSLMSVAQVRSILSKTKLVDTTGIFDSPPPMRTVNIQIDTEKELRETIEEEKLSLDLPFRFGKGVEVDYTLENSGEWFQTEKGRIWKIKIKSVKAYSLSLIFSKLIIRGQTEIYIYNEEGTMIYGPINSKSISTKGGFKSDIIKGDALILELFEPKAEKGTSILQLSRVVHGFRDVFQPTMFGQSFGCQDDVSCNSNWSVQSNGVAMIILSNMERICSGSLLNNACQDFTPNILTAFHCVDIGNDIDHIYPCSDNEVGNGSLTNQEIANSENWIFRFQYKRPNCNSGSEPISFYTFQQATFRAGWFNTDFALVEMEQSPLLGDPNSNIKYLGWSRSNVAPTSGAFLGHPHGDVMKISPYGIVATNSSEINWLICPYYPFRQNTSPLNTHWTTTITDGANEGGSSGGPFFDQNGRVVGQLHGGSGGCAPKISHGGRFDVSWTGGGTDATRLSTWLTNNPNVTQTNTISLPFITGSTPLCSLERPFTIYNIPEGDSIIWNCSSNILRISSQGSNPCSFEGTGSGSGWIDATLVSSCSTNIILERFDLQVNPPSNFISFDYHQDCNTVTLTADIPLYTTVTWNASSNFSIDGYSSPYTKLGNSIVVTSTNSQGGNVYGTTDIGCPITEYSEFCPCQPWEDAEISWLWPSPAPAEPLEGEVSPLQQDAWAYKWYIGDELIETTDDGILYTHNWHCTSELPPIYVAGLTSCGQTVLIYGGDFSPLCSGNKMESNVNLYPNPATDQVTIELKETPDVKPPIKSINYKAKLSEITQIKIIDKLGMIRKISKFGKGNKQITMNISDLINGLYYFEISDGIKNVRIPLVKGK
jgi:hypothetical protein